MGRNGRELAVICVVLLAGSSVLAAGTGGRDSVMTTGSLFEEMVDMTNLAAFPRPACRMVQFSSYDHRSQLPGGPD
ncbi:MAG: hypothetical protein ACYTAS_03690 [Planctomycetota bacterium]|jgi:hypothetical protein